MNKLQKTERILKTTHDVETDQKPSEPPNTETKVTP